MWARWQKTEADTGGIRVPFYTPVTCCCGWATLRCAPRSNCAMIDSAFTISIFGSACCWNDSSVISPQHTISNISATKGGATENASLRVDTLDFVLESFDDRKGGACHGLCWARTFLLAGFPERDRIPACVKSIASTTRPRPSPYSRRRRPSPPDDPWVLASLADYWLRRRRCRKGHWFVPARDQVAPHDPVGMWAWRTLREDGRVGGSRGVVPKGDRAGERRQQRLHATAWAHRTSSDPPRCQDEFRALSSAKCGGSRGGSTTSISARGATTSPQGACPMRETGTRRRSGWRKTGLAGTRSLPSWCRTQGSLDEPEALYRKAHRGRTRLPAGYLLLRSVYEEDRGGRWRSGCMRRFPNGHASGRVMRDIDRRMHAKLGDYEEAERVLRDALREELESGSPDPRRRRSRGNRGGRLPETFGYDLSEADL